MDNSYVLLSSGSVDVHVAASASVAASVVVVVVVVAVVAVFCCGGVSRWRRKLWAFCSLTYRYCPS